MNVNSSELYRPRTMHLFSGVGGGIYSDLLLGHRPICAVEINEHCQQVLSQRQKDNIFPWFPIFDDVKSFDGKSWRGLVDIIAGGFPCTDISVAGKGAGIDGEKSGLWSEMARIVSEVRPELVLVENSPAIVGRGLVRVVSDFAKIGYDCIWDCFSAREIGAPHKRERLFLLAYSNSYRRKGQNIPLQQGRQDHASIKFGGSCEITSNASSNGLERPVHLGNCEKENVEIRGGTSERGIMPSCWESDHPEPGILGVDDDLADWKQRIEACGNGQVACVAAAAYLKLKGRIDV